MPARAPTPCRKPACAALCRDGSGYCTAHTGEGWARHQAGRTVTERGYGHAWRKVRAMVLRRDKALCQSCAAAGRHVVATDVDHVLPKSQGGTDDLHNLMALCRRCHEAKTIRDLGGSIRTGFDPHGVPVDTGHHWHDAKGGRVKCSG